MTKGHKNKGLKEPSGPAGFRLEDLLLIPSGKKAFHIMEQYPLPPTYACRQPGAFPSYVIVFLVPSYHGGPRMNLLLRYERDTSSDEGIEPAHLQAYKQMIDRCAEPGSTFFADRIKVLPYLAAGAGWVMSKLVNNQPGLICAALETRQFQGDGYIEVDIDAEGFKSGPFSTFAKKIIDVVRPKVASLVIDLAFMLQGNEEAELPERLIGSIRLARLDLANPFVEDPSECESKKW
eukprot:CAMPEP_0119349652 /NCGR_PEP_ID=MMETSP1333-20130426/109660_1 /TAXON_ID=418940 /ORGANISM="Scyphosphaera apsteinii, Strain RCC1455" /LENGTH=234 /DNA_ID=CAMNT_0007362253 /DNA_START=60 /DNA_END=761 /DNA_ORIENTATION=+